MVAAHHSERLDPRLGPMQRPRWRWPARPARSDDSGLAMAEMVAGMSVALIVSASLLAVTTMAIRLMSYGQDIQQAGSNPVLHGLARSAASIHLPVECDNPADENRRSACLAFSPDPAGPQLAAHPSAASFPTSPAPGQPTPLCWVTLPVAGTPPAGQPDNTPDPRRLECWHYDADLDAVMVSSFSTQMADAADHFSLADATWFNPTTRALGSGVVGVAWECHPRPPGQLGECPAGHAVDRVDVYICMAVEPRRSVGRGDIVPLCNDAHPEFDGSLVGESLHLRVTPGAA